MLAKIKFHILALLLFTLQGSLSFGDNLLNIVIAGESNGVIKIKLRSDLAPKHVERVKYLTSNGFYNNVVFHRVIEGFMAQTGDVEYGNRDNFVEDRVGMGGSNLPDLKSEFSDERFLTGTLGMARSSDPDSANSQFFIMFQEASHLNNKYTIIGTVVEGMDVLLNIKKGDRKRNGSVSNPDYMQKVFLD
jgi:peptidyl-prolyl cis-trans isomerase B (cyclophilin B)